MSKQTDTLIDNATVSRSTEMGNILALCAIASAISDLAEAINSQGNIAKAITDGTNNLSERL